MGDADRLDGAEHRHVEVTTAAQFVTERIGCDPADRDRAGFVPRARREEARQVSWFQVDDGNRFFGRHLK
ncbi:hypothetical protein [Streptomyces sp. NPDC000618]|uniref:hypothetical protein n=1 Tax=Streptomyces sp. NPDC000618 TaxID=3154265 RepID=UPI003320D841